LCMDASGIPPTYPFHLAKAYSAAMPAARTPAMSAAKSVDSVEISKPRAAGVGGLVAGKVALAPNFAAAPTPDSGPLQMYRHPADKNAAATSVSLGRAVDFNA
jgi:hypothetical protein